MKITLLTLFPDMFTGPFDTSIIKRTREKNLLCLEIKNIRDYARDRYKTVDDHPYGGGQGMILKVDILDRALSSVKQKDPKPSHTVLLTPQGKRYEESDAKRLSAKKHLILICGHYEGFDDRIRSLADEEISIGDYILTGGEIPAMVLVDSIGRLLPGVYAKERVTEDESFGRTGILEYPQFTKPQTYKGADVPAVLLSGDHQKIAAWQKEQSIQRTKKRRPDLLETS